MTSSIHRYLLRFALLCLGMLAASACLRAAPAAPGLLIPPATLHADSVSLLWDRPVGHVGTTYEIMLNGKPAARTTKTHATLAGLTPDTAHTVEIRAWSASGQPTGDVSHLSFTTLKRGQSLDITRFGAVGDGATLNTKAIQAAIDACPPNGEVLVPSGVFLSGALFLKSDMTLRIAAGGTLKGSANPADYEPFYRNRFEGWEMDTYASLLNAGKLDHTSPPTLRNLSIRGEGTLSGGGRPLGLAMREKHGLRGRGRLVCLMNCANVEIAGLTIEEAPCWTLHYIYSENVSIHGVRLTSDVRNGDGIDPDSSVNSYIFGCTLATGDDCIAIKSGKNPEGNTVNKPTLNVHIVDCVFPRGHGISIGSEMSGGVRGVVVRDCVAGALLHGLQIKGTKDRGGFVEDVDVRDCELQKISILTKLNYNNDGAAAVSAPLFRNFRFASIDLTTAPVKDPVIIVNGFEQPGHRTSKVTFDDVRLPAGARIVIDQAEDLRFTRVHTPGGGQPSYEITNAGDVRK